jgi:hypothetical protein
MSSPEDLTRPTVPTQDLTVLTPGLSISELVGLLAQLDPNMGRECRRQFKIDHLCQLNFDQGSKAGCLAPGCG